MAGAGRLTVALLALLMPCGTNSVAQTEAAIVRGRVEDAAGRPLGDFPVLVVDGGGRSVPLRTGRDGRFQTIGLTAGAVRIQLDAQGYAQAEVRCRVHSGQSAFVEFFAAAATGAAVPAARCRIESPTSDLYIID